MTNIRESATQKDLLRSANFEPVFDDDDNIVDLRELRVPTDRRRGMRAMRELVDADYPAGSAVQNGWTHKQLAILRQKAPLAAHYLKPSMKWDARSGTMRNGVLIQIPQEVIWTLFEALFEGQYSIEVMSITSDSEEVNPLGMDHKGQKSDDAPGRLFDVSANVRVTIHLADGHGARNYDGVGVSYGDVGMEKCGNIFALNNARRTAEKGAVSDATREAISKIGPVFRRAFEDGDEMIDHIESLLLAEIAERNKPAIHRGSSARKTVPAPARRASPPPAAARAEKDPQAEAPQAEAPDAGASKPAGPDAAGATPDAASETDAGAQDESATEASQEVSGDAGHAMVRVPGHDSMPVTDPGVVATVIDAILAFCTTRQEGEALLEANSAIIPDDPDARAEIEEALASLEDDPTTGQASSAQARTDPAPAGAAPADADADGLPDFPLPAGQADAGDDGAEDKAVDVPVIEVGKKTGKEVLAEMLEHAKTLDTQEKKNAFSERNQEAFRKLTPKQMTTFVNATVT